VTAPRARVGPLSLCLGPGGGEASDDEGDGATATHAAAPPPSIDLVQAWMEARRYVEAGLLPRDLVAPHGEEEEEEEDEEDEEEEEEEQDL